MFFPRLRRRAKWVFILLAAVFALGFLAFGVGTGVQGGNIGDIIADVFGSGSSEALSVEKAREKVEENPNDAEALLELARALQAERQTLEAIDVLKRYTVLRPTEVDALRQLGALYDLRAADARARASALQAEASRQGFAQNTLASLGSTFAFALAQDPITQALSSDANRRLSVQVTEIRGLYKQEAEVYEQVSRLVPDEPTVFLQLGQAAQLAEETDQAITAYQRYLELAPDTVEAAPVRETLAALIFGSDFGAVPVDEVKKLAEENPDDPDAALRLAISLQGEQQTGEAKAAFQRFLELAPDDPRAPFARDALTQLEPGETG